MWIIVGYKHSVYSCVPQFYLYSHKQTQKSLVLWSHLTFSISHLGWDSRPISLHQQMLLNIYAILDLHCSSLIFYFFHSEDVRCYVFSKLISHLSRSQIQLQPFDSQIILEKMGIKIMGESLEFFSFLVASGERYPESFPTWLTFQALVKGPHYINDVFFVLYL